MRRDRQQTSARATFVSPFALTDKVYVDNYKDLVACVVGHLWTHEDGPQVKLAWMANGDAKSAWFEEWRLTAVQA
jgi:hypothetical protein